MAARIILVTGGARSGKSAYAESLFQNEGQVTYIATAQITDEEMAERIEFHQRSRPQGWTTLEAPERLDKVWTTIDLPRSLLLDCLSFLTSNIMFDLTREYERISAEMQRAVEDIVVQEVEALIRQVRKTAGMLAIVTNEVGWSIVPDNHVARVYRDILGRVNQRVAALCDEVYLVACGIPLRLK